MKIAHVSATFAPYQCGTANVCYHNAHQLAQLGHEVHVFTAAVPQAAALESCDGFIIHRLRPLVQVGNAPLLPQLLWSLRGFDVIHLHYPFFGGEITTWAAQLSGTPLVVTYHQDVHLIQPLRQVIATILRHSVGRLTLRGAARLLFTSRDYGQASYVRPMLEGCEEAIDELPNGADLERFSPRQTSHDVPSFNSFASDDRIALLVAALDEAHDFKGVEVFLKALAQLPDDVKGVIVGDGNLRAAYEAQVQALSLSQRVFFAGRVSDHDLPHYYRLADVTVLPSITMGEAFGLVLVESLASGTPIIASDLPGVRTVVANNVDGFLVQPNDETDLAKTLARLFMIPAVVRQRMGLAGRHKVKRRYAWASIGKRLEGIYREVAASQKKKMACQHEYV